MMPEWTSSTNSAKPAKAQAKFSKLSAWCRCWWSCTPSLIRGSQLRPPLLSRLRHSCWNVLLVVATLLWILFKCVMLTVLFVISLAAVTVEELLTNSHNVRKG